MRHRTATTRGILAAGATLLLLIGSAAPVGAGSTLQFKIEIDLDNQAAGEHFIGVSPLVCEDGTAFTDFHFGTGTPTSRSFTFHLAKFIDCGADGTFWIKVDAASNQVLGRGTVGGWTVINGSGTGSLSTIAGGGSIVGEPGDGDPIDLIDHYYGVLRR
jgi:hypothetical protein